jgi:hypothetical protein
VVKSRRIFREAQHPRDDRGRFAKKGGGRWASRVVRGFEAGFGDTSAAQPGMRGSTVGGGVLDLGAISRGNAGFNRPKAVKRGERSAPGLSGFMAQPTAKDAPEGTGSFLERQAASMAARKAAGGGTATPKVAAAVGPDVRKIMKDAGVSRPEDQTASERLDQATGRLRAGAPPAQVAKYLRDSADSLARQLDEEGGDEDSPERNRMRQSIRSLRGAADAVEASDSTRKPAFIAKAEKEMAEKRGETAGKKVAAKDLPAGHALFEVPRPGGGRRFELRNGDGTTVGVLDSATYYKDTKAPGSRIVFRRTEKEGFSASLDATYARANGIPASKFSVPGGVRPTRGDAIRALATHLSDMRSGGAGPKGDGQASKPDATMAKLSDDRLRTGLVMYGTNTPQGRKIVAEMQRRGLPLSTDRDRRKLAGGSNTEADAIAATLAELPADLVPDDQTRRQFVSQWRGKWHVEMGGQPQYMATTASKREALQWIVDAQKEREKLAALKVADRVDTSRDTRKTGGVTTTTPKPESHDDTIARLTRESEQKSADARTQSLATMDGRPPTDGRPDGVAAAISNKGWDLDRSKGRAAHMSPDIARSGNGTLDGEEVRAEVMNPKDGVGPYRYRIYRWSDGSTVETGEDMDVNKVFAKADRIFSGQRGKAPARSAGKAVRFEARRTERPKDRSRGDFGKGPFYDYKVMEIDQDGNEREALSTSSMSRAEDAAKQRNDKEAAAGTLMEALDDRVRELDVRDEAKRKPFVPLRDPDPTSREGLALSLRSAPVGGLKNIGDDLAAREISYAEAADKVSQWVRSLAGRTTSDVNRQALADLEARLRAAGRADLTPPTTSTVPGSSEVVYAGMKRSTLLAIARMKGISPRGKDNTTLAKEVAAHDVRERNTGKPIAFEPDPNAITRAEFDMLPVEQRDVIVEKLRKVANSGDQKSRTIPSNRTSMGTTIRGLVPADHVTRAKEKLRELTYTAPPSVDNSVSGKAIRLSAATSAGEARSILSGSTIADLDDIGRLSGLGRVMTSWKRDKAVAYLVNRSVAGDRMPESYDADSVADALRGASPEQALAVLDAIETSRGISKTELQAVADKLGVGKLTGDKRATMHALAGKAGGAGPKAPLDTSGVTGQSGGMNATTDTLAGPTLGVTTSSRGRTTTVTLPDGTTAQRTSKTMTYTHAVVGTTDLHARAADLQSKVEERKRFVAALEQWIAEGSDKSKLKPYRTRTRSLAEQERGRSNVEYYLPGFGPVMKKGYGRGASTYLQDVNRYALPDFEDSETYSYKFTDEHNGKTRWEVYGPAYVLQEQRDSIARWTDETAKLESGPRFEYKVARWSQRADTAFAAIGSPEVGEDNTTYQVIGVGGVATADGKPAKIVPTAEEKAATKAAAAQAERERIAKSNREWVARKIDEVRRSVADGQEATLGGVTEAGALMLAREVGVPIPRLRSDRAGLKQAIADKIKADATGNAGLPNTDMPNPPAGVVTPADAVTALNNTTTRAMARAILANLTAAQLREVAKLLREGGITIRSGATKDDIRRAIVEYAVGRLADAMAIERTGGGRR